MIENNTETNPITSLIGNIFGAILVGTIDDQTNR